MSINDIQEELDTINPNKSTPKTINDVLDNNIKYLEDFVNNKVINIYSRPWNKLEPKLKKKKLIQFLKYNLEINEINNTDYDILSNKLLKEIDIGKKINLEYNIETCQIDNFDYKIYL